jgi:hypothetical protein
VWWSGRKNQRWKMFLLYHRVGLWSSGDHYSFCCRIICRPGERPSLVLDNWWNLKCTNHCSKWIWDRIGAHQVMELDDGHGDGLSDGSNTPTWKRRKRKTK